MTGGETDDDQPRSAHDRRAFLRRAGVGSAAAGAAWLAPSVLTLDQAFAVTSSCAIGNTVNWPAGFVQGAPGTTTLGTLANYNPGGSPPGWTVYSGADGMIIRFLLTNNPQAATRLIFYPNGSFPDFNTGVQPGTRSGVSGFYSMLMNNAATNEGARLVITFSKKVTSFTLPMIELTRYPAGNTGSRYTDRMIVTGYNNYQNVGGPQATVPIATSFVGANVTTAIASNTLTATGTQSPVNTSASSVTAQLTGPLDAIVIDYVQARAGVSSANGAFMFVGLGNLTWTC